MPKRENFKILYALSFAWQLGFLIAAPLALMIILGLWLDKVLNTGPLLVILGVLAGLVVTAYEVYNMLTPLIHKQNKKNG
jgi:F0F1-type ATP synthase assembly protein I